MRICGGVSFVVIAIAFCACIPSFERDIDAGVFDAGQSDGRAADVLPTDGDIEDTSGDVPDGGVACTPNWVAEHARPAVSPRPALLTVSEESTGACIRRLSAFDEDAARQVVPSTGYDSGGEHVFMAEPQGTFFEMHELEGFARVEPVFRTQRDRPPSWVTGERRYRYALDLTIREDNVERGTRDRVWRDFSDDVRMVQADATMFVNVYRRHWISDDHRRVALTVGSNAACETCRIFTYEIGDPTAMDESDHSRLGTSDDDGRGNAPAWVDLSPDGQYVIGAFRDGGRTVLRSNVFDLSGEWSSAAGQGFTVTEVTGSFAQIAEGQPAYVWDTGNAVFVYDFLADETFTVSEDFADCDSCTLSIAAAWDVPGWVVVATSCTGDDCPSDAAGAIELVDIRGVAGAAAIPRYTVGWTRAPGGTGNASRIYASRDLRRIIYTSHWDTEEVRDFYELSIPELPPDTER